MKSHHDHPLFVSEAGQMNDALETPEQKIARLETENAVLTDDLKMVTDAYNLLKTKCEMLTTDANVIAKAANKTK